MRQGIVSADVAPFPGFFRACPDAAAILDRAGGVVQANAAFAALVGRCPSDVAGRPLGASLHPDDAGRIGPVLAALLANGSAETVLRIRGADGCDRRCVARLWAEPGAPVAYLTLRPEPSPCKADLAGDQHELRRLREVAERTGNLVMATDAEQRITWVNPAFERRTGYALAEVLGLRPGPLLQCPETDPETIARFRAAAAAGLPIRCEILNRARDGTRYWVDIDVQPTHDAAGALTGFVAIETDVTAARRARGALEDARDRLRATLAATPDLVLEIDSGAQALAERPHARTPFPFAAPPDAGRTLEQVLPPDAAQAVRRAVETASRNGRTERIDFRMEVDGVASWWELSAARRDAPEGGFVAVLRDVTRRVRAMEALAYEQALFRSLFALSPAATTLSDLEAGVCVEANPAFQRLSALSPDVLKGLPMLRTLRAVDPEAPVPALRAALLEYGEAGPCELRGPNGFVGVLRATALRAPDGRRLVWTRIEDVGERRRHAAERERLADEARAARRQLESAIEALPDGFVHFDADGRVVLCNRRYREFHPRSGAAIALGARAEDVLRAGLAAGEYPEAVGWEDAWLAERLAERHLPRIERERRTTDGRWLRIIEEATPNGGRVCMAVDVTALKRAEARLERTIQGAQAGTWEWTLATGGHVVNAAWCEILGYAPDEIEPIDYAVWRRLLHPDDWAEADRITARIRSGADHAFAFEMRMRHKDGRWVWILSRGQVVVRDAAGAPEVIAGVHLDVSERKALEHALLAERDYLARLMETSISGIVAIDAEGRISFANSEAERLLGLRQSEIEGKCYDDPAWGVQDLDGGPFPDARTPFRQVMETGRAVRDVRHAIVWPNGARRALSINAAPMLQNGRTTRVVCAVTDITDQIRVEDELRAAKERAEEASRIKSEFLASMSHEIRTPLTGVIGMAELLEAELAAPKHRQMAATIRESGRVLTILLNDLLDMARIEAGKVGLESLPVRPEEIVEKARTLHELAARDKGLRLDLDVAEGSGDRTGDPHRILQIVNNLLSNAIKFTAEGGVSMRVSAVPGADLEVEVADTGIGMTADQVARIFEPFVQGDGSTTRRFGGSGLGMAIVGRLVDLMGGRVAVESAPGAGTRVRISLPLRAAAPAAPSAETAALAPEADAAAPAPRPLAGRRALVADDTETNRLVLRAMLTAAGMDLTLVEDGALAVAAWTPGAFDVVLLDIAMPGMDGIAAMQAIRRKAEALGAPRPATIAITANTMTHQIEDYLAAGFDAHLAKPFGSAQLRAQIAGVIDAARRADGAEPVGAAAVGAGVAADPAAR